MFRITLSIRGCRILSHERMCAVVFLPIHSTSLHVPPAFTLPPPNRLLFLLYFHFFRPKVKEKQPKNAKCLTNKMVMSSLLMCSWVIVRMFFETPQIRYLPFRIHHANIEHFCTLYEKFHSPRNNCTMFNREIVVETKTQTKTKINKNGQWNFARKFSLFRVSKIGLFIRRKKQNDGG